MHASNSISNLLVGCCLLLVCMARIEANYYDEAANEAALNDRFQSYRKDIQKLGDEIVKLRKNLAESPSNKTISIASIQETMANQRDILFKLRADLTLPFNYTLCDCYNWTVQQRNDLQNELDVIKSSIQRLEADGTLKIKCRKAEVLNGLITSQKEYVRAIEAALNSNCCKKKSAKAQDHRTPTGLVDLLSSEFQTNLKAQSWCYGTLSPDQVRLAYFSRSTNNNVTNCPLVHPYWNGTHCINCGESQAFDLSLKQCTQVLSFDSRTHQCKYIADVAPQPKEPAVLKETQVKVINTQQKVVREVVEPHEQPAIPTTFITKQQTHRKNVNLVMDPLYHQPHRTIIRKTQSQKPVEHTVDPLVMKPTQTTLRTTFKSEYVHRVVDPVVSEPERTTVARISSTVNQQSVVEPMETEPAKTIVQKSTREVSEVKAVNPLEAEPLKTVIQKRTREIQKVEQITPEEQDPTKSIIETKSKLVPKVETVEPATKEPEKSTQETKVKTSEIQQSLAPLEAEPSKSIIETKLKTGIKQQEVSPVEKEPERTIIQTKRRQQNKQDTVTPLETDPSKSIIETKLKTGIKQQEVSPVQKQPERTIVETKRRQQNKLDTVTPLEADPNKSVVETKLRQETLQQSVTPVESDPTKKLIETRQVLRKDIVQPTTTDPNKSILETKFRTSSVVSAVAPNEAPATTSTTL